jgi:hypothetical protein
MSDNVTLFPNIMQPAIVLKAYAPMSVRFWENQENTLSGFCRMALINALSPLVEVSTSNPILVHRSATTLST